MFRLLHWRSLFRRRRFETEMKEEFAFHRAARIEDLRERGFSREEAERRAHLEFGGTEAHSEACREAHRLHWLDELSRDIRYFFRTARKNPGFAATAILSLALGIGMNAAVFSIFEALLLRPLPVAHPGGLTFVEAKTGSSFSFPDYREFRDSNSSFSGLAGYRIEPMDLENRQSPERIWGYLATGNYFDVLGVKPALGRFFHQQDDQRPGASPYAVLSYNSWRARFASDPLIVGRKVRIDGLSYTILGVAPRDFHGTELFYWPEIWVPMMMQPHIDAGNGWLDNRFTWDTLIFGRLKSGVTAAQATEDLDRTANELARRFPDSDHGLEMKLSKLGFMGAALRGSVRLFLGGLLLLVALVLLTACLNLAGLLLARSSDRQREMAIRSSIGASSGRIMRQVLTESVILSFLGGLFGLTLATLLCRLLSQWRAPIDLPIQLDVNPDWRVFLFAGAVSLITGLLFGLMPALQLSKTDLSGVLKGAVATSVFKPRLSFALRDLLVTAEVALCFVLVFASLLSIRGLRNVLHMPLGFDPENVTVASFDVSLPAYNEAQGNAFRSQVLDRVRELPGVTSAAFANSLPLSMDQSTTGVQSENQAASRGREAKRANYYQISPGLLAALRIRLLNGRDFDRHDTQRSAPVAIVNRTFTSRIMHTDQPVGKTFRFGFGEGRRIRVVGLVEDGKYVSLTEAPRPVVFWPIEQQYNGTTTLVVRTRRPSAEVVSDIRRLVSAMDNRLPIYGAGNLKDMLGFALFPMHAAALALSAFGLLAIALAVTGIHGLVAYAVSRRTREIGIRIAVGARSAEILRFLLTRMIVLVSFGIAIGLVLSMAAGKALAFVVYGAAPRDPFLLAVVCLSLLSAVALSCWRPAARALRIDPASALRCE